MRCTKGECYICRRTPHPPIFSYVENRSPFPLRGRLVYDIADSLKVCCGRQPVNGVAVATGEPFLSYLIFTISQRLSFHIFIKIAERLVIDKSENLCYN